MSGTPDHQSTPPRSTPRGGHGRYIRTPDGAARAARAVQLRAQGLTFQAIADELGYKSKSAVHEAIGRALRDVVADDVEALRRKESERLDGLYEEALAVLERTHHAHSNGRLVRDDDGEPLIDDGPKLAAVKELRQIRESYRKLYGLDAPTKLSVDAEQLGQEIAGLLAEVTDGDSDN